MKTKPNIKKYFVYLNCMYQQSPVTVECYGIKVGETDFSLNSDTIYVADGGLNFVLQNKVAFNEIIWAGDKDSLNKQAKKYIQSPSPHKTRITLNTKKNFSDFSALLDKIRTENKNSKVYLEIHCGLGHRKDHEYANLLEASLFIEQLPKGGICYFSGGIILSSIKFTLFGMKNRIFSVFTQSPQKAFVQITGAFYSGKFFLQRPSHGLSNKGKNDKVCFHPKRNSIFWIFT